MSKIDKIISLQDAAKLVHDGDMISAGGNVLHRAPMGFIRELVRLGKKNLRFVKTAGAHEIDLLAAAGCLESVDAGFVSYETKLGLASHYRKGVQSGNIKANEHACYTVISALRAAKTGVGFMPVAGLKISDLIEKNDYFNVIKDPFTGEDITVVKAISPDVAIIHVQECDEEGNAAIYGPRFEDFLIAEASKRVILTTERIVEHSKFTRDPNLTVIPGFLVDHIVRLPKGAKPCSCYGLYEIDEKELRDFLEAKNQYLETYLKCYESIDHVKSWRY